MSGFDNEVLFADNWDFRGTSPVQGQATTAGDLPIGTGGSPAIKVGQLTSTDSTLDISYDDPNIDLSVGDTLATLYIGDSGSAVPATNQLNIEGLTVSNATYSKPLFVSATGSTLTHNIQVSSAITGAPGDKFDAGICSFDDTEFVVDSDGYVSLVGTAGAPAIQKLDGDGGGSVGPNAAGTVFIQGSTVANAHNAKPVWTEDTPGSNLQEIEVQVTTAIAGAPGDSNDAGLASFDSADFTSDPNGYVQLVNPLGLTEGAYNLGVSYSAGTFTVNAADGTSLSSTNPGYIVMASKSNPGQLVRYTITADQSFIDDAGTSEIAGNLFGFTTSVAITVDVPFFIYAVTNDDEDTIQFMLSRVPNRETSPAAANIGAPDDAVADAQADFFSFDNIDETLYDSNPCLNIGSIRMRMSAADDWTVQALATTDGIGNFNEHRTFSTPPGQFGANSGTFTLNGGGTAPVFTQKTETYMLKKNGNVEVFLELSGDGGTDGSGAVSASCTVPFISKVETYGSVNYRVNTAGNNLVGAIRANNVNNNILFRNGNSSTQNVQWADFTGGTRFITTSFTTTVKNT